MNGDDETLRQVGSGQPLPHVCTRSMQVHRHLMPRVSVNAHRERIGHGIDAGSGVDLADQITPRVGARRGGHEGTEVGVGVIVWRA